MMIPGWSAYFTVHSRESRAIGPILSNAMRRTEQEANRMARLVEDMLTLAKLDELGERVPEGMFVRALDKSTGELLAFLGVLESAAWTSAVAGLLADTDWSE